MIALGILVATSLAEKEAKKRGLDAEKIFSFVFYCIIGGIAGGKILYWITILNEIVKNPSILLEFSNGFVVYGAIIGAILAGIFFCRIKKLDILDYLDLVMPYGALAQCFGRIGCFLAGCCYGMESHSALAVVFPAGGLAPAGIPLFPIQLVSSLLDLLHFFFLLYISKKVKHKGQVVSIYFICYAIGRFILEYFRGDLERGSVGLFSTSQFISIFILVFGIVFFLITNKQNEKLS